MRPSGNVSIPAYAVQDEVAAGIERSEEIAEENAPFVVIEKAWLRWKLGGDLLEVCHRSTFFLWAKQDPLVGPRTKAWREHDPQHRYEDQKRE
jgi:hypothetical protein